MIRCNVEITSCNFKGVIYNRIDISQSSKNDNNNQSSLISFHKQQKHHLPFTY